MDALFRWLAESDAGLLPGRIQGIAWSLIDLVIVGSLLRISALATGRVPWLRWILLSATGLAVPFILVVRTVDEFFALEAAICGMQFALLVWTAWFDRTAMLVLIEQRTKGPI